MMMWKSDLGRLVPKSYMELISPLRGHVFSMCEPRPPRTTKDVITKVKLEEPYLGSKKDGRNEPNGWMEGWMDGWAQPCVVPL